MATNMFIDFNGPDINGGSTSKGHEGQVEVLSWNHGFSQTTSPVRSAAGGGTVEKANHMSFTITKMLDSATDDLLKCCWSGQHIDKVIFAAYRSSGDTGGTQSGIAYLKVEMESVIVSSVSIGGSSGDLPIENVTLDYAKVTYTYTGQDKSEGTASAAQPVFHDLRDHTIG